MNVPNHVAIILDGNGRWAKAKGMPRTYGHAAGAKNVEPICRAAYDLGIKYLTLYAFSTENWKRPKEEVSTLMKLLGNYVKKCMKLSVENNMRVRFIGDLSGIPQKLNEAIHLLEETSKDFTGLQLQIDELTEDMISSMLDTGEIPDPDLMIRTSGEERLSNFLLWQLAYAEFYFTPTPWPDFNREALELAIQEYDRRNRRFGGI